MEGANKRQPKYKNLLHGALYVEKGGENIEHTASLQFFQHNLVEIVGKVWFGGDFSQKVVLAFAWSVRKERNYRIFEGKNRKATGIWEQIQLLASVWASSSKYFDSIHLRWEGSIC